MNSPSARVRPEIEPAELKRRLGTGETFCLADVRSGGEFAGGRIAGARLLPLSELGQWRETLARDQPVVCICQSGARSASARATLEQAGFDVTHLRGGMNAWAADGLPMERDARAPWSLERQVRVTAGFLVVSGVSLGWFVHPAFLLLSAFVGSGLVFAGVTDWCGMGLVLARAPWNQRR